MSLDCCALKVACIFIFKIFFFFFARRPISHVALDDVDLKASLFTMNALKSRCLGDREGL